MLKGKKNAKVKAAVLDAADELLKNKDIKLCAVMCYDNRGEKYGIVLGGGDENDIKKFAEAMKECSQAISAGVGVTDSDDDAGNTGGPEKLLDDEALSDEDLVRLRIAKILLDRGLADEDGELTLKFLRIIQKFHAKAVSDKNSKEMAMDILKECVGDKLTDEEWEIAKRINERED